MIEETAGDLFEADVETLVNAVNTVGVMGKGLALAFKRRFPDNFAAYRAACEAGELTPGRVHVFERRERPRWIVNLPTKRHWREASRLEDIESGLASLIREVEARAMHSIAIPALGCGLGGLAWQDVRPLIVQACARLPDVRFVVFPPA